MQTTNATLAELLSAVLKHPDCPVPLYNTMVDEISDMQNDNPPDGDTPEYIGAILNLYDGPTLSDSDERTVEVSARVFDIVRRVEMMEVANASN